jgi:hypothetical protein
MGWKAYQTAKIQAWIERTKGGQNPLFRAKDIKPEDYFPRSAPRHQPRLRAYREYTTKKTTTDLLTTSLFTIVMGAMLFSLVIAVAAALVHEAARL